jgi:hypothetical protein
MEVPGADMLMNMGSKGDTTLPALESISLDFDEFPAPSSSSSSAPPPQLVPNASEIGPSKSWDGIQNMNAEAYFVPPAKPVMSEDALMKEKYEILRKFERLGKMGVPIRKRFTMDSPLDEMKMELEFIRKEKAMDSTIKQFSEWFITGMSAMEWGSKNVNMLKMFGLQLDGLSQSAQMNVGDMEEDFEELYELYGDNMRVHPLVRIPMRTCMMVYMVHLTNQMAMKAPIPNIQDILRQNPEIGRQLASEAMKTQTAGFRQTTASAPPPQQQRYSAPAPPPPPANNPLSGLMSFLGGTQQPAPQSTSLPQLAPETKKVVNVPTFGNPLPKMSNVTRPSVATAAPPTPRHELPPPSGGGIADILRGIQAEKAPVKSALKKTPTSSAGKSPKNSVVIKL